MKRFEQDIQRRLKHLRSHRTGNAWSALGQMGAAGWLFVLPVVGGAYLGWWLDGKYQQASTVSWTITGILAGVMVGLFFLYQQVYRVNVHPEEKEQDQD